MQSTIKPFKIKLYVDGADPESMIEMASKSFISGLTTNPTLMRKAGVSNYVSFAKILLNEIRDKPISFEVFSDDLQEMARQGFQISSWADNVYVKIPVTNTKGESTVSVIKELTSAGVKVNVTALMTSSQVGQVIKALNPAVASNISIFAGRIADTGVDPTLIIKDCLQIMSEVPSVELIWASPRELLNIFQADAIGCHIITASSDILKKLNLIGYDLLDYSLDTVKMFHEDAKKAGYEI